MALEFKDLKIYSSRVFDTAKQPASATLSRAFAETLSAFGAEKGKSVKGPSATSESSPGGNQD